MTKINDSPDDHDFNVDGGRGQAPRLQSKSWKQQQQQQETRRKSGPTAYNGIHRRRKRRMTW